MVSYILFSACLFLWHFSCLSISFMFCQSTRRSSFNIWLLVIFSGLIPSIGEHLTQDRGCFGTCSAVVGFLPYKSCFSTFVVSHFSQIPGGNEKGRQKIGKGRLGFIPKLIFISSVVTAKQRVVSPLSVYASKSFLINPCACIYFANPYSDA